MRTAVIIFPGSNRDGDVAFALTKASGQRPHRIWHQETDLPTGTDLVVLPGGFSYGDYLRCGAIAARSPVMEAIRTHAAKGGLVMGVCNGFQILIEAGLLPGALMRNAGLHFICKLQTLTITRNDTAFMSAYKPDQTVHFPIAHGDGNFCCDAETLRRLEGEGLVALRYGNGAKNDAQNPNGSHNAIAGIYSEKLNVLGLMPHPENAIESKTGSEDGLALFTGLTKTLLAA